MSSKSPIQLGAVAAYEPFRRVNSLNYSERFDNAIWTKTKSSIVADAVAAPPGFTGNLADKLVEDNTTGGHQVIQNTNNKLAVSTTYTFSVYAKAAERTSIDVQALALDGATVPRAIFNLGDGTVTSTADGATAAISSIGSGWYRCSITFSSGTGASATNVYVLLYNGADSYAGDGASGAYIFGAQFQQGSTATAYESTGPMQVLYDRSGNGRHGYLGSTKGAGLDGTGLVLPGVSGAYASAPDSAALSITGDIDIRVKCAAADWTPSAVQHLAAKFVFTASNNRAYFLRIETAGKLEFGYSITGIDGFSELSTVATGVTDGATKWVRCTVDVNDGSGNHVTRFYLSDDGSAWTQLGTDVTTVGTIAIFDSTATLEIGTRDGGSGTGAFAGTIYRVQILNGIAGTVAFDADFAAQPLGAGSFAESSANAAIVSVNAAAADSNDPAFSGTGLFFTTDDYAQIADGAWNNFGAAFTVFVIFKAAAQASKVLAAQYDISSQRAWLMYSDASAISKLHIILSNSGAYDAASKDYTGSQVALDDTWHSAAFTFNAGTLKLYVDGVEDTSPTKTQDGGMVSIFNSTAAISLGAYLNGGAPTQFLTGTEGVFVPLPTALTALQVAQLHAYYKTQLAAVGVTLPAGPDVVEPVLASAAVPAAGTTVVLTFTETETQPLLPASSITGFSVTVNSVTRSISSASRTANAQITLTLASPVGPGQTVLVSYTPGNVTDSASFANALAAFSNSAVTNNSTADIIAPTLSAAAVPSAGATVVLDFTEAGSSPLLPATSVTGFSVTVAGVSRSITAAARTASTQITLTLASLVYPAQVVLVSYSGGNVTDSAAVPNSLATITNAAVTNNSTADAVAPILATATVADAGTTVALTFVESASPPLLPASGVTGFSLTTNGLSVVIASATRTASTTITLTLGQTIHAGDVVLLSYSGGNVTDSASPANSLATVTNAAVTNNSLIEAGFGERLQLMYTRRKRMF